MEPREGAGFEGGSGVGTPQFKSSFVILGRDRRYCCVVIASEAWRSMYPT